MDMYMHAYLSNYPLLSSLPAAIPHVLRRTFTSTNSTTVYQFFPIPRWQIIMIIATESSPTSPYTKEVLGSSPNFRILVGLPSFWMTCVYSQRFRTLVGFRFGLAPFANRWWQGDAAALALRLQQLLAEREEVAGTAGTMAELGRWVVSLPSYDLWG